MRGKPLIGLSIAAAAALVGGMLSTPATLAPAAANDSSVFTGPTYPSAECTSLINGNPYGIVPQQIRALTAKQRSEIRPSNVP